MIDRNPSFPFFLLVAASLLLTACASASGNRPAPQASGELGPLEASAELAPDFEITLYQGQERVGGERIMLSEILDQGQPVVLNFWAGLCPPCRIEMPDLQSAYDSRSDHLLLIGVDVGPFTNLGTREEGQELLQELAVTYPAGTTFNQSVLQEYGVLGMPSTYFITTDGVIVESWSGLLTEDKMIELMDELLATSSQGS